MGKKQAKTTDADFIDSMGVDTKPSEDKLRAVKNAVKRVRDLDVAMATLDEARSKAGGEKFELVHSKLPEMYIEIGIDRLGIDADGDLPAYDTQLKPYYKANIPQDKQAEAFAWLRKKGHGALIKNMFDVALGMGDDAKAKRLEDFLKKEKISFERKQGVPWNTLTAFVKEQIEDRKVKLKDLPLDLLGATIGQVVTLKPRKAKD